MLLNHTIGPSEAAELEALLARWADQFDIAARRAILSGRGADALALAALAAEVESARFEVLEDEKILGYRLTGETQARMLLACGIFPAGYLVAYDHQAPDPARSWKVTGPDGGAWHAESTEQAAAAIRARLVAVHGAAGKATG